MQRKHLFAGPALAALAEDEDFGSVVKRTQAEKPKFAQRQQDLFSTWCAAIEVLRS